MSGIYPNFVYYNDISGNTVSRKRYIEKPTGWLFLQKIVYSKNKIKYSLMTVKILHKFNKKQLFTTVTNNYVPINHRPI